MAAVLIFLLIAGSAVGKIIEVPFVKQHSQFCGPAALSSVFRYYGLEISQEEIGKKVYTPKLKGALISDLENFARSKGFKTISGQGNINKIKSFIDQGIPVIVLVDLGFWIISKPHYLVVVGYNKKGFTAHTGYEKNKLIPYEEFEKIWKKSGNVFLSVYR